MSNHVGYDPTIEDSFRKQVQVDDNHVVLDILDTAGQEEFDVLRDQYMHGGEVFVIVWSVTDAKSYEDVEDFYESIKRVKDVEKWPGIILAVTSCLTSGEQV